MTRDGRSTEDGPVGIVGAGRLGQALARTIRRTDREVILANRRGEDSLATIVTEIGDGVSAGNVQDAADCSIVFLAVPWTSVETVLAGLTLDGNVVVDTTNAVLIPSLEPIPLGGRTSSEVVAELASGARVVKAANTLGSDTLAADPVVGEGRRVLFMSGDDIGAKHAVATLFDAAGFYTIDVGDLATGGALHQAGGPLARHNLLRLPPF